MDTPPRSSGGTSGAAERWLYICDWLPPDFGAVGQYSLLFAGQLAEEGRAVVLAGLSSTTDSETTSPRGAGQLTEIRFAAPTYDKTSLVKRLAWIALTNTRMLWRLRRHMREADVILFTGSPPFLLHWLAPLNLLMRKRLIYRITDFHPECLIAQRGHAGLALTAALKLTEFWRRRVTEFEILGYDQRQRLVDIGIAPDRMRLKRDPSPVEIPAATRPMPRPPEAEGKLLLLYSGNWGVAHDYATFLAAYRQHHREGSGRFVLWLNAVGAAVPEIEHYLAEHNLPYIRGKPVPLDDLARLLVTPDAHLITLLDPFVGFVMPSKVYGCIESHRPVLFIGSASCDVHLLCEQHLAGVYTRADVGDVPGGFRALETLADRVDETTRRTPA